MSAQDAWDAVIAGAGHNSLVCGAYLACAGLRVLVLERNAQIGGDTSTDELTLPGFKHDACASAHVLIQSSPMIRENELNLSRYGLRYIQPDPVVVMPFVGGRSLTMFRDRQRTAREIARFSEHDSHAYIQMLDDWDLIKDAQNRARYSGPVAPSASLAALEATAPGLEAVRWRMSSALDTIRERFEDEHVRTFLLWMSLMTMAWIDQPGTGLLPLSLTAGRQSFSWTTPQGGSVALPNALAAIIREHGGEIRTNAEVARIVVEDGRATGVELTDGSRSMARRAVVSSLHVKHLPAAVGAEWLGENFVRALDHWQAGVTMFVSHYAIDRPAEYRLETGAAPSVAAGIADSVDDMLDALHAFRRGEIRTKRAPLLVVSSSVADPTRAPAGQHTLKVVGFLPYKLRVGGPTRWDAIKNEVSDALLERYLGFTVNLTKENILGRHVESPLDLERRNPHNYHGSCHGGDQNLAQEGALRMVPGWSGYRLPVAGLYQTGSTTHPGASVTGAPGRNCASAVLEDLGSTLQAAIGRATTAPA